jgi:hypothetical protein
LQTLYIEYQDSNHHQNTIYQPEIFISFVTVSLFFVTFTWEKSEKMGQEVKLRIK